MTEGAKPTPFAGGKFPLSFHFTTILKMGKFDLLTTLQKSQWKACYSPGFRDWKVFKDNLEPNLCQCFYCQHIAVDGRWGNDAAVDNAAVISVC